MTEEKLNGGNVNAVTRVGETVHRSGQWNPQVHCLLQFLREQGFDGAPKFLGIDEDGRETLSNGPTLQYEEMGHSSD